MARAPSPSKVEAQRQREYMAEDDLRTLTHADEIRLDRRRLSAAKRLAQKKVTITRRLFKGTR